MTSSSCNLHPFIDVSQSVLPGDNAFPYSVARFHPEHFHVSLYKYFGIDIPPSIAVSVQKRQAEFLAGRVCAQAMFHYQGRSETQVGIGMHRAPQWPEGLVGSITHNSQFSAAIVNADPFVRGIGIDIESIFEPSLARTVIHQIATRQEMSHLSAPSSELSTEQRLTLLFSAKESFFKAAFPQVGQYFEFSAVELIQFDPEISKMQFRCVDTLSRRLPRNSHFAACYRSLDKATLLTSVVLA